MGKEKSNLAKAAVTGIVGTGVVVATPLVVARVVVGVVIATPFIIVGGTLGLLGYGGYKLVLGVGHLAKKVKNRKKNKRHRSKQHKEFMAHFESAPGDPSRGVQGIRTAEIISALPVPEIKPVNDSAQNVTQEDRRVSMVGGDVKSVHDGGLFSSKQCTRETIVSSEVAAKKTYSCN